MKQALIINFRRIGDLVSTSHLINQMNLKGFSVSLLIFEEYKTVAKTLKSVDSIYCIKRKKIEKFLKSELFHDSLALDELVASLSPIIEKSWNQIINLSNDPFGTRVCSFLSETCQVQAKGITHTSDHRIYSSNIWSTIYNDVISQTFNSPIHYQDIYHQMSIGENYTPSNSIKFEIDCKYERQTKEAIHQIKSKNKGPCAVLGIQVKTSDPSKDIPFPTLIGVINNLLQNHLDIIPVLIIAPNPKERELAKRIVYELNQHVISVEADLKALPCVVKNLDGLLSPDTAIVHYADCFNIPTLELSFGNSPFLKQGTIGHQSGILTQRVDKRIANNDQEKPILEAEDITSCLRYILFHSEIPKISSGYTLYRSIHDELGMRYVAVAGDICPQTEARRVIAREYLFRQIHGKVSISNVYTGFKELYGREMLQFITYEKSKITATTRVLLAALRSIARAKEGSDMNTTLNYIDQLFDLADEDNILCSFPLRFFRVEVENLQSASSRNKNLEQLEGSFFKLKSNIQTLLKCIELFESICSNKQRERLQEISP